MSNNLLVIQIKICDEETGIIGPDILKTYNGSYGWEIEAIFDSLAQQVVYIMDPGYNDG